MSLQMTQCHSFSWLSDVHGSTMCNIARTQNQPKCPPTEEWMKNMWYIYSRVLGFITIFFAAPQLCTVLQGTWVPELETRAEAGLTLHV